MGRSGSDQALGRFGDDQPFRRATAVDVGKSKILIGEVDPSDPHTSQVDRIEIPKSPSQGVDDLLTRVRDSHATIYSVGVALFGPLDTDPRSSTYGAIRNASDPGWEGLNVPRSIFEATGRPVRFHYDTQAALVSAQQFDLAGLPLSLVAVGTGIGAAHEVDRIDDHVPQFGHLWIRRREDDHFVGSCSFHRDCLQGMASGGALAARVHADPTDLTADHPALDLAQHYLAHGLHAVECVLGPRHFVLTGGLGLRPLFVEGVSRHLEAIQEQSNGVGGPGTASCLEVAPAGYLSALHGAAVMAIDVDSRGGTGRGRVSMVYPPRT